MQKVNTFNQNQKITNKKTKNMNEIQTTKGNINYFKNCTIIKNFLSMVLFNFERSMPQFCLQFFRQQNS